MSVSSVETSIEALKTLCSSAFVRIMLNHKNSWLAKKRATKVTHHEIVNQIYRDKAIIRQKKHMK